jgi:hypothetical protein
MPEIASSSGAEVVEINPAETPLTASRISNYILKGPSGEVLSRVAARVKELLKSAGR